MKFGTIARWVFSVLGTHRRIIKLASVEGIPLTKIWRFASMVPSIVFEAFIWLVPRGKRDLEPESRSPDSRQQILISSGLTWPIEAGFFTAMVLSIMMCIVALYTVAVVVDNMLAAVDSDGLILLLSPC